MRKLRNADGVDEEQLIAAAKKGSNRAVELLMDIHGGLMDLIVSKWAKSFRRAGWHREDDFRQEARLGFLRAIDKYDPDKAKTRGLGSIAYSEMWYAVQEFHRNMSGACALPRRVVQKRRDEYLEGIEHGLKTPDMAAPMPTIDSDEEGWRDGSHALASFASRTEWSPEEEATQRVEEELLRDALNSLKEPERSCVTMKYAIGHRHGMTYEDIGEIVGIPPHLVGYRVRCGLSKLSEILADG